MVKKTIENCKSNTCESDVEFKGGKVVESCGTCGATEELNYRSVDVLKSTADSLLRYISEMAGSKESLDLMESNFEVICELQLAVHETLNEIKM